MSRVIWDQPERVGTWVMSQLGTVWSTTSHAIGLEVEGQIVSGTVYEGINEASIVLHTALTIITRPLLWYTFDYPFNQLCVQKLIGPVASTNQKARRLDEHLGFVLEATLKDAAPGGDLLIYTMTREQCRWLNLRNPSGKESGKGPELSGSSN